MPRIKRLTHEESKAQTRRRLIAAGRELFLRYGFSKSSAEEITKRAGYTRGALYSNFGDKEGLFRAVVRESHNQNIQAFGKLVDEHSGEDLLNALRQGYVDLLSSPEYLLRLEFELECLRNDALWQGYAEVNEEVLLDSSKLMTKIQQTSDLCFAMDPRDFVISLQSFARGLAIKQLLLRPEITLEDTRRLMFAFFDRTLFRVKPNPKAKSRRMA
jgi:AcrR family transcriptional regulator